MKERMKYSSYSAEFMDLKELHAFANENHALLPGKW